MTLSQAAVGMERLRVDIIDLTVGGAYDGDAVVMTAESVYQMEMYFSVPCCLLIRLDKTAANAVGFNPGQTIELDRADKKTNRILSHISYFNHDVSRAVCVLPAGRQRPGIFGRTFDDLRCSRGAQAQAMHAMDERP